MDWRNALGASQFVGSFTATGSSKKKLFAGSNNGKSLSLADICLAGSGTTAGPSVVWLTSEHRWLSGTITTAFTGTYATAISTVFGPVYLHKTGMPNYSHAFDIPISTLRSGALYLNKNKSGSVHYAITHFMADA